MALRPLALALTLFAALPATAQTIDSVAPELLRRGATTEVIVRGESLGATSGVTLTGDGVTVSGLEVTDELVRFDVGVGATAPLGARDLELLGADVGVDDALEVVAGSIEILAITPGAGSRGESLTLDVRGANLDTITDYEFGGGVDVTGWTSPSATSGTVSIEILEEAFAGARAVTASRPGDEFTLFGGFEVSGGTPTFVDVLPPRGDRGTTVDLRIEGTNLDAVDSISLGSRVTIESFEVESPTLAHARVALREDAAAGTRDLTLRYGEGESVVGERAFNVRRGEIDVIQVRPDRVRQGDVLFVTIDGLNLDGTTDVDFGEGVEVVAIDSDFPTSIAVDIEVALDAPTGFRDITIDAPAGTFVVEDGLLIGDFIPPELQVSIPVETDFGDVQLGTYGRGGVTIENLGELPETIVVEGIAGDIDLFAVLDENDQRTNRVEFELGIGERRDLVVEFSPELRGRTGVEYSVTARDGEEIGTSIVRATGTRAQLTFGPAPPFDFGEHPANERAPLQRVDTDLLDGVPARQTNVIGWEFRAIRDDVPVENDEFMTVDFISTIGGDLFWGTTEVFMTVQGRPGSYEGELLLLTDSADAAIVPFGFFLTLTGEALPDEEPSDVGSDTGDADVGPDASPDVPGEDVSTDTPTADTGSDTGVDTPSADVGPTDSGTDGTPTDTGAETGGGGGGGGGCCATATRRPPSPLVAFLVMAGLLAVRRRS